MSNRNLGNRFKDIFTRLLAGESLDTYKKELSQIFEFISTELLSASTSRKNQYFDGVVELSAIIRNSRQVEFEGEMWVGSEQKQWTEKFQCQVIDKQITKQGIWIVIQVGTDRAESELTSIFSMTS